VCEIIFLYPCGDLPAVGGLRLWEILVFAVAVFISFVY